jgi:sterol desaturase/sphingolipid hydroxylase (fatty acid hydroxylase superfamily)
VNAIALAVPAFFPIFGFEWWLERKEHPKLYRLNHTLNDLSPGGIQQLLEIFARTTLFSAYVWLYEHFLMVIPKWRSGLSFGGRIYRADFCYYRFHRISDEVAFS